MAQPLPAAAWWEAVAAPAITDTSGASILPIQDKQERITVRGVRLTRGNAVDCPQIRTSDGTVVSVHHLAADIAIGDCVEVSGFMANMTTCLGPVLYVEKVHRRC